MWELNTAVDSNQYPLIDPNKYPDDMSFHVYPDEVREKVRSLLPEKPSLYSIEQVKNFRDTAAVGSKCLYMGREFELIESGEEKLVMLSKILIKPEYNEYGNNNQTRLDWMEEIAITTNLPRLKVMDAEQLSLVNKTLLPNHYVYLTFSHYYESFYQAWCPVSNHVQSERLDTPSWYTSTRYSRNSLRVALRCFLDIDE